MLARRINFASAIAAIPSNFKTNYNVLLSSMAMILDIYKKFRKVYGNICLIWSTLFFKPRQSKHRDTRHSSSQTTTLGLSFSSFFLLPPCLLFSFPQTTKSHSLSSLAFSLCISIVVDVVKDTFVYNLKPKFFKMLRDLFSCTLEILQVMMKVDMDMSCGLGMH